MTEGTAHITARGKNRACGMLREIKQGQLLKAAYFHKISPWNIVYYKALQVNSEEQVIFIKIMFTFL